MGIKRCFYDTKKYFKDISDDELSNIYQGWSYDLRLGEDSYITSDEYPNKLNEINPYLIIKPGDFALLITYESINLDNNTMAFISVRFKYKKQGLINISGFHVDPNYNDKIIFSVYNAGPSDIILKYKESVFMIFFQTLENNFSGIEKCENKYCNIEKINEKCKKGVARSEGHKGIPISYISEIKGQSVSLAENRQKIDIMEKQLKIYAGLVGSVIIALLSIIVALIIAKFPTS